MNPLPKKNLGKKTPTGNYVLRIILNLIQLYFTSQRFFILLPQITICIFLSGNVTWTEQPTYRVTSLSNWPIFRGKRYSLTRNRCAAGLPGDSRDCSCLVGFRVGYLPIHPGLSKPKSSATGKTHLKKICAHKLNMLYFSRPVSRIVITTHGRGF